MYIFNRSKNAPTKGNRDLRHNFIDLLGDAIGVACLFIMTGGFLVIAHAFS